MGFKHCAEGHVMDPSWKYCPVCIAPLCGWLVELKEEKAGKVYQIHEGKSFIGSAVDCEIRILHESVCRQHMYLTVCDGECTVVDMGNGEPIKVNNLQAVKTSLIDGDIIQMGDIIFKIKLL